MTGRKKRRELTEQQQTEIKHAFEVFDADNSGAIDAEELQNAMKNLGFQSSMEEIKRMIDEVNNDGSGEVSYLEFEEMMAKLILGPEKEDVEDTSKRKKKKPKREISESQTVEIRQAFEAFDTDGSGNIDADELERAMKVLGMSATKEEVEKMIADHDTTGSGEVEFDEFLDMMTNLMLGKESQEDEDEDTNSKNRARSKAKAKQVQQKPPVNKRRVDEDDDPGGQLLRMAEEGNLEKARKLVTRWENSQMAARPLNQEDSLGRTSLVRAVRRANVQFVQFLLAQNHIDLERADHDKYTALHHAILLDHHSVNTGIDSSVNDTSTPSGTWGAEIAGMLVRAGANLEALDAEGYTPLMLCARFGASDVVKVLLELGAKPHQKCPQGLTALEHAKKGRDAVGRQRATELLREWGLEPTPDQEINEKMLDQEDVIDPEAPQKELLKDLDNRCDQFERDLKNQLAALTSALLPEVRMANRQYLQQAVRDEAETLIKELQRDKSYRVHVVGRAADDLDDEVAEHFANMSMDEPAPEMSPNPKWGMTSLGLNKRTSLSRG